MSVGLSIPQYSRCRNDCFKYDEVMDPKLLDKSVKLGEFGSLVPE